MSTTPLISNILLIICWAGSWDDIFISVYMPRKYYVICHGKVYPTNMSERACVCVCVCMSGGRAVGWLTKGLD